MINNITLMQSPLTLIAQVLCYCSTMPWIDHFCGSGGTSLVGLQGQHSREPRSIQTVTGYRAIESRNLAPSASPHVSSRLPRPPRCRAAPISVPPDSHCRCRRRILSGGCLLSTKEGRKEGRKGRSWEEAMGEFSKESCPSVKTILLLDSEGKRVAVKYFSDDWSTNASKLTFEKSVFTKTLKTNARSEAEVTLFDGYIVVYKFIQDLHFFVVAGDDENELIIANVLQGFSDSIGLLLRGDVEKRTALENLDMILLCIDEIIDGGIILETDANIIAGKVASNAVDGSAPFSEQTISQALATAREHFARSLLK
ncbi:hypothetical protein GUJ93_ZPchr0013g37337 [Zizania palustris]|uniref:Coatomer subunit zeta n=1 Tax=Zizania palustris TaxID=103762 RepID=A0A8J5X1P4_ZIZPA|nr:hypothetical protein GUJ93_ZPchr0013g37337 [Zizania palustris]